MKFRNHRHAPFTAIPNRLLRDSKLSLKAKGLLALMLSFPDDWTYHESHLVGQSTDGRDGFRAGMKELVKAGYVCRERKRDEHGRLRDAEYIVSDEPLPKDGKSNVGESNVGETYVGKSPTTNTDITKKDSTKTENPLVASATKKGSSLSLLGNSRPTAKAERRGAAANPVQYRHGTIHVPGVGKDEPPEVSEPKPKPKDGREAFYNRCLDEWNRLAERIPNWTAHRKVTKRVKGQLRELLEHCDGDTQAAYQLFVCAMTEAQRQDWVQQRESVTLANVGSNSKLIDYGEAYRARVLGTDKVLPTPVFNPGDSAIFKSEMLDDSGEPGREIAVIVQSADERVVVAYGAEGDEFEGEMMQGHPSRFRRYGSAN